MKNIFFILLFVSTFISSLNAQIGVCIGSFQGIQYKTNPKHKYGVIARVSAGFHGGSNPAGLYAMGEEKAWAIYPQLNIIRRFAYREDYNFYWGLGIAKYFYKSDTIQKRQRFIFNMPCIGIELKPFKKHQNWLISFESGMRGYIFSEKSYSERVLAPFGTVDMTIYFR